ncbi:uncharacterized protein PHACADRAFT_252817 [Phanerochaete carnosa HHB-10118-sp]|uniref:Rieske domain-containing protein n=1 Tax=Phanerochaete carnosa (strain HHB-10118-sp) TaxID=650164 RepID=K5X6I5_PHACS|nr:uncharacterized protein PHACADRAFT_252817 [Phanerochaete carnosa HHB-10118-sp]EKM58472.1 hypothetical protein PHACADRAFT_252817 [Phanerochaete carnosa HHB-10118-sp]
MSSKTIAVLSESELKDGEMKEVAFEGEGKVLLSRLGNKIHATSAFCTHYGAPLAKGVLTADGRVVCSTCFNVCNGDIEDAPAPSALHSFKAEVKDGQIHVTADPENTNKKNMSRQPKLLATGSAQSTTPGVVIVGGGSGAFHAVESLREHGYNGAITVFSKETHAPIDRTKLSKALVTDPSKLEWRSAAELKGKYGVTLRTGVEVTQVDVKGKSVTVGSSGERVQYETLVLATGGTPRQLPVQGKELGKIFTLRGVDDAKKIDSEVQEGKNFMELVAAVSKRNLASIDVIGMESAPFEAVLGTEVGKALQKFHESKGVKFHMKSSVSKLVPSTSSPSDVGTVVVKGPEGQETELAADVVIMGVGVAPATEYLKNSEGIKDLVDKSGAIAVDEFLRVKGLDGSVFGIGDIALYPQPGTGELRRIEHWNVAGNQGRAVGKTIAEGGQGQPFVKVPVFWSAQGQQLRYCGVGAGFDDIIVDGNLEEMKFVVYYVKGDKVIAVASMQRDPVVSKASELLRLDLMPSPSELRAGKDLLTVDIASTAAKIKVA